MTNIVAAWIGFSLGCISGAIPGLFFQNQDWLGGYTSWPRRLIRLAHISFRALHHQRCGCPIKAPYAWNIRMKPCHTTVYDTNAPIKACASRLRSIRCWHRVVSGTKPRIPLAHKRNNGYRQFSLVLQARSRTLKWIDDLEKGLELAQ